jgi:anthranilate phosphoribosyltransferase
MLDVALLNAGAAIYVGGGPGSLADGVAKARAAIESGAAEDLLSRFVALTQELAPVAA